MWDALDWVPTVEIVPIVMSEAEKEEFRTAWLASRAEDIGLAPVPDIPRERWVSGVDFGESVGSCLAEAGFEGVWDGRYGFEFPQGIAASQDLAFERASYECDARFSIDPVFMQEWSSDQIGLLYDYWEEFYVPCLAAHGVGVDMSAPSREAYVAAFHTPERISWWPEEALASVSAGKRESVSQVCDPYPPDDVFYGGGS